MSDRKAGQQIEIERGVEPIWVSDPLIVRVVCRRQAGIGGGGIPVVVVVANARPRRTRMRGLSVRQQLKDRSPPFAASLPRKPRSIRHGLPPASIGIRSIGGRCVLLGLGRQSKLQGPKPKAERPTTQPRVGANARSCHLTHSHKSSRVTFPWLTWGSGAPNPHFYRRRARRIRGVQNETDSEAAGTPESTQSAQSAARRRLRFQAVAQERSHINSDPKKSPQLNAP